MLHLSLEAEDAQILRQVVEAALVDLRREIWHTDSRKFRELLTQRADALQRVLEELTAAVPAAM